MNGRPMWILVGRGFLTVLLSAVVVMGWLGLLLGKHVSLPVTAMMWITAASASFVLISVVQGGLQSSRGRLIVAGLIGCFLGDVLGPRDFLLGVACFLLAHLFFIAAFLLSGPNVGRGIRATGLFGALSGIVLLTMLRGVEGADRWAAVLYAGVISVMVGAAAGLSDRPGGRWILSAAIVFYVSDIAVAGWRFVGGDFPYDWCCYPLYYSACTMLALSAGNLPGSSRASRKRKLSYSD